VGVIILLVTCPFIIFGSFLPNFSFRSFSSHFYFGGLPDLSYGSLPAIF
jgi:hypothetical protein